MRTIYDNFEEERLGFSGGQEHTIKSNGFSIDISRGWASRGTHSHVPAYMVGIYLEEVGWHSSLFDIITYAGGDLFSFLKSNSCFDEKNHQAIFNFVFVTAAQKSNTAELFASLLKEAYSEGHRRGKEAVQVAMREALGLE